VIASVNAGARRSCEVVNALLAEIPATLGLKAALAIGEAWLRMENMVMVGSSLVWD
jgi:hypothetical protein